MYLSIMAPKILRREKPSTQDKLEPAEPAVSESSVSLTPEERQKKYEEAKSRIFQDHVAEEPRDVRTSTDSVAKAEFNINPNDPDYYRAPVYFAPVYYWQPGSTPLPPHGYPSTDTTQYK